MRFLANENFPLESVHRLRKAGHDVLAIAESQPGAKDPQVLALGARDGRVLLTFDRDYGELLYRRGLPAPLGVLYLRLVPETPIQPAEIILGLSRVVGLQIEGRYTVVEAQRIRQRPLP